MTLDVINCSRNQILDGAMIGGVHDGTGRTIVRGKRDSRVQQKLLANHTSQTA
jgi:hypothetical protein